MHLPKQVAIIGAGPTGLMAAEILAMAGHGVTVYDRMPSPARKFLIAGRGGLNLTHSEPLPAFTARYGSEAAWLAPSINRFSPETLRAWCHGLGEETFVGSSGRVFPRSMKSVRLLRAWLQRLEQLGVRYHPRHQWQGWQGAALCFTKAGQESVQVTADATLLALGGASWPRLGSDGSWVPLLTAAGVEVAPLRPANSGFIVPWSALFQTKFAGMPLKNIAITHQGVTRHGEAMITAQGMEGGLIYAFSRAVRDAIETQGPATLSFDLRPGITTDALARKLEARANKSLSTHLRKAGCSPLAIHLLREVTPADRLTTLSPQALATRLKQLPITLLGCMPIARAISSAGGIRRSALDASFMLQAKPGTFAAGEMLDWEAPTGGYLLQGCFSTGVAAAEGILHYLASDRARCQ